ncbi:hypothetical protein LDO26_05875 [Luteimonas sp. BDR2-5]|uniref:hypothetical protein n=1 Tax=Proluteimonas luteida TaxID=2878685 RepID=UPI001E4475CC|nr:hypothetical protein [Luteimonas sp. BDR2-5]MCD9027733.1 hypothetical protein [Luteimonas sp. BDR2-5]
MSPKGKSTGRPQTTKLADIVAKAAKRVKDGTFADIDAASVWALHEYRPHLDPQSDPGNYGTAKRDMKRRIKAAL